MLPSIIENHKEEQDSRMGKMNPVSKAPDSDATTLKEMLIFIGLYIKNPYKSQGFQVLFNILKCI